MSSIYDYLDKYGKKTFDYFEYTEVDNIIFTQISYLDFRDIVSSGNDQIKLSDAGNRFIHKKYNHVSRKRLNLLKTILTLDRYKDLLLSNYVYKLTDDEQFGALTIDIHDHLRCVVFEGTDNTIVGWKEDFSLAYLPLIPAAGDAIKYLDKVARDSSKIIVTGHSKGGYLAIISAMYSSFSTKRKLKKIYSLDGPGIKKEELESKRFDSIKNKYIKIVPNSSIIGKLFYDIENPIICDSKVSGILAHSVFFWKLKDNQFKRDKATKFSNDLDNNLTSWIESYSNEDIKYFCNYLFNTLDSIGIKMTYDLKNMDRDTYIKLLKSIENTDSRFRKMLEEFLSIVKSYYVDDMKKTYSIIFDLYHQLRNNHIG